MSKGKTPRWRIMCRAMATVTNRPIEQMEQLFIQAFPKPWPAGMTQLFGEYEAEMELQRITKDPEMMLQFAVMVGNTAFKNQKTVGPSPSQN